MEFLQILRSQATMSNGSEAFKTLVTSKNQFSLLFVSVFHALSLPIESCTAQASIKLGPDFFLRQRGFV